MRFRASIGLILAASIAASCGGGRTELVVRADGQIGPYRIGVTPEQRIIAREGKPDRREKIVSYSTGKMIGHFLVYRDTVFTIGLDHRLHDFATSSSRFETARGSRVGMSVRRVEHLEGSTFARGCVGLGLGRELHVSPNLELFAMYGRVSAMYYLGPHSLYALYDARYSGNC